MSRLIVLLLAAQDPAAVPGLADRALSRLDELPRVRRSVVTGSVSSHDPSGKNDDGFSGAHSFVDRKGDGLVIARLEGPGVVYRIWTPTPTDDPIEFWFDGEPAPRIRMPWRRLFVDGPEPFRPPLVGYGAGGYFSYVPLPYARSLEIVVRAPKVQFYQVNFARYPDSTPLLSFRPETAHLDDARRLLQATGRDLSGFAAPPGAPVRRTQVSRTIRPGGRAVLYSATRGGRIVGLELASAAAFAADGRATELRIYFDGASEPAVQAPVADLFGGAWGEPAMAGLLAGTRRDTSYLWFPMPFDRAARIELRASPDAVARPIHATIFAAPVPRRADEGRFHAVWRRENPTTPGRPFTFLRASGRGHVVGAVLLAQGIGTDGTPFFEGDDRVVIDGDTTVRGTGSEDAFNGGWYDVPGRWDRRHSYPLSGSLGYSNPLARTGGYRFFLGDAYAWRNRIELTIEHGEDVTNAVPADYSAVTFFYADRDPGFRSTPLDRATRAASLPDRITLNPGWVAPIASFSVRFATITKRRDPEAGWYLSFVGDSTGDFGGHQLSLIAPIPIAGRWRISVLPLLGPEQGSVALLRDDQPVGRMLDTRAPDRRRGELVPIGELDLDRGDAVLTFRISPGAGSRAALDLIRVVLERVPTGN